MRVPKNNTNRRTEECLPCGVNSVSESAPSSFDEGETCLEGMVRAPGM